MKNIDVINKFIRGVYGNFVNSSKNLYSLNGAYLKNYNTIANQKLVCRICEDLKIPIRTTANIKEVM